MYEVDERDRVVELTDLPRSSAGAPCPAIFADEREMRVAYYLRENADHQPLQASGDGEPCAIVTVKYRALMFGPPNDEAFDGHPLASRGLQPYRMFEVHDSSWLRRLERMNSIHRSHSRESFMKLRHLIFAFHDSTFECIASSYSFEIVSGIPARLVGAERDATA